MSVTVNKIVEEFRSLEREEQGRLLEMLGREKRNSERATFARSIRGKYAHVLRAAKTSSRSSARRPGAKI
jgi:hypothetical protein